MLKKIIKGVCFGFITGVFIGYLITILISAGFGDGSYYAAVPALIQSSKSEISAVILQFMLSGVLGTVFSVGSIIWQIDSWSILKQTVVHFLITTTAMLSIAYACHWMEHSISGFLSYLLIFAAIYIVIGLFQYNFWKKRINEINSKLRNK
jgi:hypothetical protein